MKLVRPATAQTVQWCRAGGCCDNNLLSRCNLKFGEFRERAANVWRTGRELHDVATRHFEDFGRFRRHREMAVATFKDQHFWQFTQAENPAREAHRHGAAWARPRRFVADGFDHPTPRHDRNGGRVTAPLSPSGMHPVSGTHRETT